MKLFLYLIFFLIAVWRVISNENLGSTPSEDTELYKSSWVDLETRLLPQWYDEAKVGIFVHWGLYCVPGFRSEWFWYNWRSGGLDYRNFMSKNYPPGYTYQEFAPMFKAEFFDPDEWAKLFLKFGAKFVVLTSKHHDGYTLYPSKKSFSWNSVDIGPRRDLIGDLSRSVRKLGLKFGIYHSLYEWYNPIYIADRKKNFATKYFVTEKLWPDLKQLVNDYKPSVIWADGDWDAPPSYWMSKPFLAWLYNDSPVKDEVVVNDRWGVGTSGVLGDFYNFADRFNNKTLQSQKWENAFSVDESSWGYRRDMEISKIMSISDLLTQLVTTVSCGGNVLINIGPTKEGTIAPIFQDRLLALGKWLDINGQAIYKTSPWLYQNDTMNGDVWYTCTKLHYNARYPTAVPNSNDIITAIYAITLNWPRRNLLILKDFAPFLNTKKCQVEMLGNEGTYLNWTVVNGVARILFPDITTVKSENAWTLRFNIVHNKISI